MKFTLELKPARTGAPADIVCYNILRWFSRNLMVPWRKALKMEVGHTLFEESDVACGCPHKELGDPGGELAALAAMVSHDCQIQTGETEMRDTTTAVPPA